MTGIVILVFVYLVATAVTYFVTGISYATEYKPEEKKQWARAFMRSPLWPIVAAKMARKTLREIKRDARGS